VGVSPGHRVAIDREVLAAVGGQILKHGLQEMHGRVITLPARKLDRPDRELVAWRWERSDLATRSARDVPEPSG